MLVEIDPDGLRAGVAAPDTAEHRGEEEQAKPCHDEKSGDVVELLRPDLDPEEEEPAAGEVHQHRLVGQMRAAVPANPRRQVVDGERHRHDPPLEAPVRAIYGLGKDRLSRGVERRAGTAGGHGHLFGSRVGAALRGRDGPWTGSECPALTSINRRRRQGRAGTPQAHGSHSTAVAGPPAPSRRGTCDPRRSPAPSDMPSSRCRGVPLTQGEGLSLRYDGHRSDPRPAQGARALRRMSDPSPRGLQPLRTRRTGRARPDQVLPRVRTGAGDRRRRRDDEDAGLRRHGRRRAAQDAWRTGGGRSSGCCSRRTSSAGRFARSRPMRRSPSRRSGCACSGAASSSGSSRATGRWSGGCWR